MPQSPRLQETIRASAETRRQGANAVLRARAELAETRAATRKTIIESQQLMAEAEAVIAGRAPLAKPAAVNLASCRETRCVGGRQLRAKGGKQ
jgi:hypothetical protein